MITSLGSPEHLEVRVLTSLDALTQEEWQVLTAQSSLYYTRQWLSAVAPDIGEALQLFAAYRAERLVGALPAFRVTDTREFVYHNVLEAVVEPDQMAEVTRPRFPRAPRLALRLGRTLVNGLRPFLNAALFPNLVVTSPYAYVSEVLLRFDEPEPEQVIDALLDALEQHSDAQGLQCTAFLWIEATQQRLLQALRRRGYRLTFSGAAERLDVRWNSLTEYLAGFKSGRRVRIKKEMATFREAGFRVREDVPWSAIEDQAMEQALQLQQRHGHDPEAVRLAERYRRLCRGMEQTVTLTAWTGDQLVGFLTAFRHGDILYPKLIGFDYAKAANGYVYFNLTYYQLLEIAMRLGVRQIHYGSGTHEAKLMRGCQMVPLYMGYRFKHRWVERLADLYLPTFHHYKSQRYAAMASTYEESGGMLNGWPPVGDMLP